MNDKTSTDSSQTSGRQDNDEPKQNDDKSSTPSLDGIITRSVGDSHPDSKD